MLLLCEVLDGLLDLHDARLDDRGKLCSGLRGLAPQRQEHDRHSYEAELAGCTVNGSAVVTAPVGEGLARAGRLKWPYIVVGDDACIQKCSCTLGKEERNIYSAPFIDTTRAHACPCPFREHVGREIEGVGCKPITRDPIGPRRLTKSAIVCESSFKASDFRHANESCERDVISNSWAANCATERTETNSDRRRPIRPLINTSSMMQEKRGSQVDWVGGRDGGRARGRPSD